MACTLLFSEALAARVRHGKFLLVPEASHFLLWQQRPELLNAALVSFLGAGDTRETGEGAGLNVARG